MSDACIQARGLSKLYRIGERTERYQSLRDVLAALPRRWFAAEATEKNSFWALRDVSFDVGEGEVVGVIGRNGAGKSTLLKILSRITEPTSGEATVRGRVGSLLEIGTGFHPELTGRENIYLNGAILGMRRREVERKFDEIVAFAEVERFLDTAVKHYSSGMYLRLAFAVAAHMDTEVLLVDEVLAVGDAAFQKKCLGKMGTVASQGRTVLFVSHNMTALSSLCQRALWLAEGRLVDDGPAGGVVARYLQTALDGKTEATWPEPSGAPGGDRVRLAAVRLTPQTDNSTDPTTVETSLEISIEYWNQMTGSRLHVSMFLYSLEGICVFNVASDPKSWPIGLIRTRCLIPGGVLNDGVFSVRIMILENSTAIVDVSDVISFEVQDLPRAGHWFGKWPGVVRPRFEWTDELVNGGARTAKAVGFGVNE